jgi:hypothetical protein
MVDTSGRESVNQSGGSASSASVGDGRPAESRHDFSARRSVRFAKRLEVSAVSAIVVVAERLHRGADGCVAPQRGASTGSIGLPVCLRWTPPLARKCLV